MQRGGSVRLSHDGRTPRRLSRLQLFLILLLAFNLLAISQMLLSESKTVRSLVFKGRRYMGMQFDSSVEVWARGNSTSSQQDAQLLRRCEYS